MSISLKSSDIADAMDKMDNSNVHYGSIVVPKMLVSADLAYAIAQHNGCSVEQLKGIRIYDQEDSEEKTKPLFP